MTAVDRMSGPAAESMNASPDPFSHLTDVVAQVYGHGFTDDGEPKQLPGGITALTVNRQVTLTSTGAALDNQRRTTLWPENGAWQVATEEVTPVPGSAFNNGKARVVRTTHPLVGGAKQTVAVYTADIIHAPEMGFNRYGVAAGSRLVVDYANPVESCELPEMSEESREVFAAQMQGVVDAVLAARQQTMAAGERHAAEVERRRRSGFFGALGNIAAALWRPVGPR